ncbi:MAG: LuxR C-terminal-related transcriptional regulator [Hespellia sp.]|nr:LuxR C-terminal-related transcriptional regulator [Hespellia sp.]
MYRTYVKVQKIYMKLKAAELEKRVIYISGSVGTGKSAAVKYFLRDKEALYLSGLDGRLNEMPSEKKIEQQYIVIDELSWITDQYSKEYIQKMIGDCEESGKVLILIGRSRLPSWLQASCIEYGFILADEQDLMFKEKQIHQMFKLHSVHVEAEVIPEIMKITKGYPIAISLIAYNMKGGENYSKEVLENARLDLYRYFSNTFYKQWNEQLKELLISMSMFPSFTIKLAEMVTGKAGIEREIERAFSVGSFISCDSQNVYHMRPVLRSFLQWRCGLERSKAQQIEIYERAALYYERNKDIKQALFYYEAAGNQKQISRILIKNAEAHVGIGYYYETKKYYMNLSPETVQESPVLMGGMSMLYSLLMQVEESEYWYEQLKEYESRQTWGSKRRREAVRRRLYLEIALPHRGTVNLIHTLKNAAVLVVNKELQMPEFSVTSNQPSIMNGGLDFCEWSKSDRKLAIIMKKPVEILLGKDFPGLVNISLAESFFEKSFEGQTNPDNYEIMTLLNNGYSLADMKGKIEMCFVAIGVMVKLHISHCQPQMAQRLLLEFREKALAEDAGRLIPNIDAMRVWLKLQAGDTDIDEELSIEEWMKDEALNENHEFFVLERYRYMIKVRVYMVMGQYEDAIKLIERLQVYFEGYARTIYGIQNQLLKAIVLYRLQRTNWEDILQMAISKAQEYQFTQIISREGIAIRSLLMESEQLEWEESYSTHVLAENDRMATFYPNYLKERGQLMEPLTKMENLIFQLLCVGSASADICDTYHISYNTLKYHNRNIYRKLGVKNRAEAVRKAKELGMF